MTLIPQYDRAKILTGLAALYLAPYDPDTPAELPADTVALGTAWSGPWTPIGATTNGVTFGFQRETQNITIEEQMTPVDVRTTGVTFNVEVELAEDTLQTMRIAYGGGTITTTAPAAGQPGVSTLVIASEMDSLALGLEGENDRGYWRRVLIPVVKSVANVSTQYRRAESPRTYSVTLQSLVDPSQVIIRNMDAPAL